MNIFSRTLSFVGLAAFAVGIYTAVTYAHKKNQDGVTSRSMPITGKVLAESYFPGSNRGGSSYTITLKTDDKIIAVSVMDTGNTSKESLDALISPGTIVSFPRGRIEMYDADFRNDIQAGNKFADQIRILNSSLEAR